RVGVTHVREEHVAHEVLRPLPRVDEALDDRGVIAEGGHGRAQRGELRAGALYRVAIPVEGRDDGTLPAPRELPREGDVRMEIAQGAERDEDDAHFSEHRPFPSGR